MKYTRDYGYEYEKKNIQSDVFDTHGISHITIIYTNANNIIMAKVNSI